jgi:hypothetical protein
VSKPYYHDRVQFGRPEPRRHRRAWLWIAAAAVILGALLAPATAHAGDTATGLVWGTCPNLKDWYVNPDETAQQPEATADGLKFTGEDLIHHKTDLALTDVHAGAFEADGTADKLVMKYETDAPYTTIVQTPDGTFWSSHISTGTGSQDHPVASPHDLIGIPQRGASGGLTEDTRVVSFGPGYWMEDGQATVDAVQFHGVTYDLTCKPAPASSSASPKPTATTTTPAPHSSTSHPAAAAAAAGGTSGGTGALAITGPNGWLLGAVGLGLLVVGAGVLAAQRRRKRFVA